MSENMKGSAEMSILNFVPGEDLNLETMAPEQLRTYQAALQKQIAELDAKEPRNMNSEAYEQWADEHEELEDAMDEVREFLDCLE
jgi:glutamine synthetase type III